MGDTIVEEVIDSKETEFIKRITEIVENNINNFEYNVELFCKDIGMSSSQLHRKITAMTGLSSIKFIHHIRMNKAKILLQNTDLNINEIAFETGFSDSAYFGRLFKMESQMTPLKWREHTRSKT